MRPRGTAPGGRPAPSRPAGPAAAAGAAPGPGTSAAARHERAGDRPLLRRALPVGVMALTGLVFVHVLGHDLVGWDDTTMLRDQAGHREPGWRAIRHAFTTTLLGHYAPLTWLSFSADAALWGTRPLGHHLTNLLLHVANAGLVYALARRLLGRATALAGLPLELGATVAALFFAVHPLRAESVAWVTERRGVLSAFFALLSVLAYLRAVDGGGGRRRLGLGVSAGAFLLALMAKESALVLPAGLVILDVYPLRRLPPPGRSWLARALWPVWRDKAAHLALAAVWVPVAYRSQAAGAQLVRLDVETWIGLVLRSLWYHVEKMLLPIRLSPLHELAGRIELTEPAVVASGLGVAAVTLAALALGRVCPAILAAWAWHVVALAPVMGPVHAGPQLTADRYSYLLGWGWALVAGGAAGVTARAALRRRPWAVALGPAWVAALALLAVLGARQGRIWEHRGTLWLHAVAVAPECATCRYNLATWLLDHGEPAAALGHFERLRARHPTIGRFEVASGVALAFLGRYEEAEGPFRRVVARMPGPEGGLVRLNLAGALIGQGRLAEGVGAVREAIEVWRPEAALAHLREAIGTTPTKAVFRLALAEAYRALGRPAEEAMERRLLARLHPELARAASAERPGGEAGRRPADRAAAGTGAPAERRRGDARPR